MNDERRAAQEELLHRLQDWWEDELITTAKGHAAVGQLIRKAREVIAE